MLRLIGFDFYSLMVAVSLSVQAKLKNFLAFVNGLWPQTKKLFRDTNSWISGSFSQRYDLVFA